MTKIIIRVTTIARNALPVPRLKTLPRPAKRLAAGLGEGVGSGVAMTDGFSLGEGEAVGVASIEDCGVPGVGEGVAVGWTAAAIFTVVWGAPEITF